MALPIVLGSAAVLGLAASTAQAIQAKTSGIQARRAQQQAQQRAEAQAISEATAAAQREKAANPTQPDALALLGKEQLSTLQGVGSAALATPKLTLGKPGALGGI